MIVASLVHDGCVKREGELHESRAGIGCERQLALYRRPIAVEQLLACRLVHDAACKLVALSRLEVAVRDLVDNRDILITHDLLGDAIRARPCLDDGWLDDD